MSGSDHRHGGGAAGVAGTNAAVVGGGGGGAGIATGAPEGGQHDGVAHSFRPHRFGLRQPVVPPARNNRRVAVRQRVNMYVLSRVAGKPTGLLGLPLLYGVLVRR